MKLRDAVNEYGTAVRFYQCEACQQKFSVCPAPKNDDNYRGCLAMDCASYDPVRDVDKLFDTGVGVDAKGRRIELVPIKASTEPEAA